MMTPPADGNPEPIRVITEEADRTGWVSTGGQRMTDILSAVESFAFLPADDPTRWTEVLAGEVVIVVPPPHVSEPGLRLPGQKHRVLITAGAYQVSGTALLRPGEQDDPILRATRRFLPLTEASFARGDEPVQYAEVVIVNLRRTSSFEVA
jgi:hypothetical protein